MRTLQFGPLRPARGGSVGDFALHLQCSWRIDGPQGIVTGCDDLWEPADADAEIDLETWSYDTSPNLQDVRVKAWFGEGVPPRIVERVEADGFGGAVIGLSGGFTLRLFPAGSHGEEWRLLRPTTDAPHFVVGEGRVEVH